MKSFLPQTRFSGMVVAIALFLVLILAFFTVYTSHENEQRTIKRGFVTLTQNAFSIKNRINSLSVLAKNKQRIPENLAYNQWVKSYSLIIDTAGKVSIANGSPTHPVKFNNVSTNDSLISSNALFSDILDDSFFDEYIVFKDSLLFYKSFETDPELLGGNYIETFKKSLYIPANFNIFKRSSDSAIFSGGWNSGFISKIDLGYNQYYLFVYPLQVNNHHWYVGGLLTNHNYQIKKRHIESWILILIGTLLIFTLFSFQFVKLLMLSKTERVKTSDLVVLCFSISGVAYVVTLLMLNFFSRQILIDNSEVRLQALNDSIKHSFTTELKLTYRAIESYEDGRHNWNDPLKPHTHILTSGELSRLVKDTAAIRRNPYIKSLFLASPNIKTEANKSLYMITPWEKDASSRIAYRQYYQKKDEWLLPDTFGDVRFRLESVYSNTNGEVLAVMAKPARYSADTVFGASSPLYSLMNTTLSPGFEFRIIGEDGKIWFHNDKRKNNQDNFLDECGYGRLLREAIHNRVEVYTTVKISEKDYQCYISPIGKLPLYLVTLCDSAEQNTFLSHVNYIFLIFILLGLVWGLVAATVFYYEKMGKYTRGSLDEDDEPGVVWLLPDTRKNHRYVILFILNIVLALFIAIPRFSKELTTIHLFCILFSAFSACAVYTYLLLKPFKKRSLPIVFSAVIVLCNVIYLVALPNFVSFFAIEMAALLFFGLVVVVVSKALRLGTPGEPEGVLKKNIPAIINKFQAKYLKPTEDPYIPYLCFVFSWIVSTCILPAFILFRTTVNEEVELTTKKNQIELAQKIEKKYLEIDSFYIKHIYPAENPTEYPYIDSIKDQLKQKGNYWLDFGTVSLTYFNKPDTHHIDRRSDSVYLALSRRMRETKKEEDIRTLQMLYDTAQSPLWQWNGGHLSKPSSDTLTLYYTSKQRNPDRLLSKVGLQIQSVLTNQKTNIYNSFDHYFLPLVVVMLLFLFLLILLLKALVKNIFVLRSYSDLNVISSSKSMMEGGNLFLINSIHQPFIKQSLTAYSIVQFEKLSIKTSGKKHLIQMNNIPDNGETWTQSLDTLEEIIENSNHQIVVVSCFTPVQIKAMIDELIITAPDNETRTAFKNVKRRLLSLFSLFTVYFYQDDDNDKEFADFLDKCLQMAPSGMDKIALKDYLSHELKFAFGFIEKREWVHQVLCSHDALQELRLNLYQLFMPYYQHIWENCTVNEKFILFDMAMDTMVNAKNRDDIRNLIGKGILTVEGKLDFVSKCFKRYVLELTNTDEFRTLEMAMKRAGGWSKVKGPIYIIFVILVVFVFFTQQDIFSGVYGAIISIAGLIGALLKFGSGNKESGESDQ